MNEELNDEGGLDEVVDEQDPNDRPEARGVLFGKLRQDHRGVTILYDGQWNWLKPEHDYAALLDGISRVPPEPFILFKSRVGIAKVALLACGLGLIFGVHLTLLIFTFSFPSPLTLWCIYALFMCVYHWSEFLITAVYHPQSCNFDSFLVNQSLEFGIAITLSWLEFWLECWLVPSLKSSYVLAPAIGIVIIIAGQCIRSLAMIQAGPSFTHIIAQSKERRHQLITHGLYSILRHPGYFGWFYWSIATQILLCNPLCAVAYFVVSQRFFKGRIPVEEAALIRIFGPEYHAYRRRTWIGIPGIP